VFVIARVRGDLTDSMRASLAAGRSASGMP
jgi:hypothetical protein